MRSSIAFCLLSICVQLTLHVCDTICGKNQYTTLWSNGSVKGCLNCDNCHPGYGLSPVCGSHIKFPAENVGCHFCPSGTFSDTYDSAPCHNCQECVPHEIVASNCTKFSDRNCTGTCTKGYYFVEQAQHNCQQCSYCCNDGNDEIQPECISQGLNATDQHCSQRPDKTCGPKPTAITTVTPVPITTPEPRTTPAPETSTPAPETSTPAPGTTPAPRIINSSTHHVVHPTNSSAWHHDQSTNHRNSSIVIGVLSGLFFAALVVGAVLYKRRKVPNTRDGRRPHSNIETGTNSGKTAVSQLPEDELVNDTLQVIVDLPQGVAHIHRFNAVQNPGYLSNSNPETPQASPGGTPHHTDDELEDLPDVNAKQRKRSVRRQNSKDAPSDSTSENLLDPKVQTFGRKGSLHNENVAEKQDIKGAEGGNRRRSSSGSLQTLMRKLSIQKEDPNYQLLSQEDPDEVQESLRIVEHPKQQTHINEGSKVVFKCKAQGKKNLSYQWLKDGTKMQGEYNCTLVFDSVKVCDFGWYSCEVRCADGQNRSECVESFPAELDVSPPDGMRFKYLNETFKDFPNTQQNVEQLLARKIPGIEGWKQVAFKWKMDELTRDSLEGSHEGPGKGVISFLKATHPELTVYEFCKTLKEPNIRRLDIVNELLVHLTI